MRFSPPPLRTEKQDDVIVAWKRAVFTVTPHDIVLTSPVKGHPIEVDGTAWCNKGWTRGVRDESSTHRSPDPECTCGFYAMRDRAEAEAEAGNSHWGNCLLEVQFFGRVIVGTRGYRAERQRIVAVHLDREGCAGWLCKAEPVGIGRTTHAPVHSQDDEDKDFVPLCRGHFDTWPPMDRLSMADLSSYLGLEVRWGRDSQQRR